MNWTRLKPMGLICLSLIFCNVFVGCSPKTEYIVLTPPPELLELCPHPEAPKELENTKNVRSYAVAATRFIADYEGALTKCNAKQSGLQKWYGVMATATSAMDAYNAGSAGVVGK